MSRGWKNKLPASLAISQLPRVKRSIAAPTMSPCFKALTMVSTAEVSEVLVVALTATTTARTLKREVRRMVLFGFCGLSRLERRMFGLYKNKTGL